MGLGLAACNNDTPDVDLEKAGTLTLTVLQGGPSTRLVGDISGDGIDTPGLAAESKINTVQVWVFASGNLEKYQSGALDTEGKIRVEGLTVGTKTVVVAANASFIGEKATLTDLKAVTNNLSQTITGGMVMTAEPEEVDLIECEENECNEYEVTVTRVNARVALTCLNVDFTELPYDNFKLTEVAMFNVPKTTKLFGEPLVAAPTEFLYGSAYPSSASSYAGCTGHLPATNTGELDATLAQENDPDDPFVYVTNAPYFYVHENDAAEQTFIVLKGTLWKGDVQYKMEGVLTDPDGYTYYRIDVNANKTGYTYQDGYTLNDGKLRRNTQYNICATLKKAGFPSIDPPLFTCLDVFVEVEPWKVVSQNVTWE